MEVVGDAARLRQVLLNLAGNAIKFTSTGGVALIVEPGIWPNEISFLVRDTGIGIAPEARERIFREFEQADERIARSYGGTGLGLEHQRAHRQAHGRPHRAGEHGRRRLDLRGVDPARRFRAPAHRRSFAAPDLSGQSIMLVAPQSIEASLIARRLQRWGGADLHGLRRRGGAGAAARAVLARGADRSCASAPPTSKRWPRPRATMRRSGS